MSTASSFNGSPFEWGVASRALAGQSLCGDLHVVIGSPGRMLAAVVDGLGHGNEATAAAKAAIDVLRAHAGDSVIGLVRRCHEALKTTRGAVLTVVSFDIREQTVTALGVGNVESILLRADPEIDPRYESVLLRSGLVGDQLPAMHASVFPLHAGDVMIFTTDGIRNDYAGQLTVSDTMPALAERILREYYRGNDDALVLAVRYKGARDG